MRRDDITPELLTKLYHEKLLSKKEIALLLNCNITTVHKKMKKFGILARKQNEAVKMAMEKQIIKIPKSKLENLYLKKNFSLTEIANKLNHDKSIIKREIKRLKIPLRSHSATMRMVANKSKIEKSLLVKLYYTNHLTQKQIGKKLNLHKETIRRLMKRYGLKPREKSEISTRYPKSDFSGNLEEKAYLSGFRAGDLNVQLSHSKNLIIARCTSTKIAQIKLFKNLFKKYGYVYVGKPKQDGNRDLLVRLNLTFNFLLSKNDDIPKWIRENKNYFLSFLAGYTDAEGCIYINNKSSVAFFQLASYDRNILKQIHNWLLKLGVPSKPPRITVKQGYIKSDGCVYRNNNWNFTINKKSSLLIFFKLLRSRLKHQKRLKDLIKAEQNIIKRNQRHLLRRASLKYLPV
jgi:predicted DNA-binding protein YlxM (UPF0122 family)